jgi:hypothetical protein
VEGRLLLDVVVRKGAAILELLAGEDQTLLVWGNTCLIEVISIRREILVFGVQVEQRTVSKIWSSLRR